LREKKKLNWEMSINSDATIEHELLLSDDDDDDDDASQKNVIAEEQNGIAVANSRRGTSFYGALASFLKSMIGSGILTLPNAFASCGVVAGAVGYLVATTVCGYTMALLLIVKASVERIDATVQTYGALAEFVLGVGGRWFVEVVVVVLQWAFCAGFLIVIGANVESMVDGFEHRYVVLATMPLLCALALLPQIKNFTAISVLGVAVYFVGVMGGTFVYGAVAWRRRPPADDINAVRWGGLLAALGTFIYSLEGINLILPIEGSLRKREQALRLNWVGMAIVGVGNSLFASFAVVFGFTCDIITQCLPDGVMLTVIKIALILALLCTHPLTLFPATELIEERLLSSSGDGEQPSDDEQQESVGPLPRRWWQHAAVQRAAIRVPQVLLTGMLAAAIPSFSTFTSILGSALLPLVGFLLPPALYAVHFYSPLATLHSRFASLPPIERVTLASAAALFIFGALFAIAGTFQSIYTLVTG
jgi:amino acid permease